MKYLVCVVLMLSLSVSFVYVSYMKKEPARNFEEISVSTEVIND